MFCSWYSRGAKVAWKKKIEVANAASRTVTRRGLGKKKTFPPYILLGLGGVCILPRLLTPLFTRLAHGFYFAKAYFSIMPVLWLIVSCVFLGKILFWSEFQLFCVTLFPYWILRNMKGHSLHLCPQHYPRYQRKNIFFLW